MSTFGVKVPYWGMLRVFFRPCARVVSLIHRQIRSCSYCPRHPGSVHCHLFPVTCEKSSCCRQGTFKAVVSLRHDNAQSVMLLTPPQPQSARRRPFLRCQLVNVTTNSIEADRCHFTKILTFSSFMATIVLGQDLVCQCACVVQMTYLK